ncbi:MAG: hypothetical protein Q9157_003818 [Trypethelium eluteriae]
MDLWIGGETEEDQTPWVKRPTWHKETRLDGSLSFQGVVDIAHAHFLWLKEQRDAGIGTSANVVAAMWDPSTRTVWASAIPRGRQKAVMESGCINGLAPVLYSQVKSVWDKTGQPIHAEDGVYYNFETMGGTITNGRYPAGSMIAAWGRYNDFDREGQKNLCFTERIRAPSCRTVAMNLGISFTPPTHPQPAGPPQPAAPPQPAPLPQAGTVRRPDNEDFGLDHDSDAEEFEQALTGADAGDADDAGAADDAGDAADDAADACDQYSDEGLDPDDFVLPVAGLRHYKRHVTRHKGRGENRSSCVQSQIPSRASPVVIPITLAPTNPVANTTIVLGHDNASGQNGKPFPNPTTTEGFLGLGHGEITPAPSLDVVTSAPSILSCTLQNEDPDQGIDARGCICGTTILPVLTVSSATDDSQSCSYTALPSSDSPNPITVQTQAWFSNCQACTLAGGVADTVTCSSVAGCTTTAPSPISTFAVNLSNNSVAIGSANKVNNGSDLRTNVYNQLRNLCPDDKNNCISTESAEIDEIATVVGHGVAWGSLKFTIADSRYDNTTNRDRMLSAVVASWQQASTRACQQVEYELERKVKSPGSGCGAGVMKRDLPTWAEMEKRSPDCCGKEPLETCTYQGTICSGPDLISAVFPGPHDPYQNRLNVEVDWKLDDDSPLDQFICEMMINGVTAAALEIAPELAGYEIFEDMEFQAVCGGK